MDDPADIVRGLYRYLLQRAPAASELEMWVGILQTENSVAGLIETFGQSEEYQTRNGVAPFFPPGHYYSPIVKPDDAVRDYMLAQGPRVGAAPKGVSIDAEAMRRFFTENAAFMASASFTEAQTPRRRYYADNGGFPLGDALTLRAMINHAQPRRIIEVGSGFSSACILDTLDETGLKAGLTCIEPYPERLRSLLRPSDPVEIIASPVQAVPLNRFRTLQSNDILFIDSTHVVKTASDVHYEIFEILPCLKPGVLVHFHDVIYPFEYPLEWIFQQNLSWNEAYFVRAFLMYNEAFSVFYSSSYMVQHAGELVRRLIPAFPPNPGTGLWLTKNRAG